MNAAIHYTEKALLLYDRCARNNSMDSFTLSMLDTQTSKVICLWLNVDLRFLPVTQNGQGDRMVGRKL